MGYNKNRGRKAKMKQGKTMIPMVDPMNGSNLRRQEDGTFLSEGTGKTFTFDASRKKFIPNYLPVEELDFEDAHIEGDYLVGNHTDKRFLIDQNGEILTEERIKMREDQEKANQQYRSRIDKQVQEIHEETKKEVEKIKEEGYLKAWKIEHEIQDLNQELDVSNQDYFQKTKEIIEQFETEPFMVEGIVRNGKCYYALGLFSTFGQENAIPKSNSTIQAKVFAYDEAFKKDFLEPLLKEFMAGESPLFLQVTPNEKNQSVASFRFLQKNGTILLLQNIETSYARSLESMALSHSHGKEASVHSFK